MFSRPNEQSFTWSTLANMDPLEDAHYAMHISEHAKDGETAERTMVDVLNTYLNPTEPSCPVEQKAVAALRVSTATKILFLCCNNDPEQVRFAVNGFDFLTNLSNLFNPEGDNDDDS